MDRTPAPGAAPRGPSLAVTVVLTLTAAALWLAVVQALLLLAPQFAVYEHLRLRLPWPAEQVYPLSRGMAGYWWAVVLGILVLTPVVGLVTYVIRHRWRWRPASWVWGLLLIVPPLVLLEGALAVAIADRRIRRVLCQVWYAGFHAREGRRAAAAESCPSGSQTVALRPLAKPLRTSPIPAP